MACGSLFFVILGAPVGILFAKRDFLSAFITCFVPIIMLYYPLMLFGVNLGKEGIAAADPRALDRQRRAGRPAGMGCRRSSGTDSEIRQVRNRQRVCIAVGVTSMRILDRQRYWAFFKAYVICYVSLVGLYIVIDAFSNLDEFTKRAEGSPSCSRSWAGTTWSTGALLRPARRRDRHDGGDLHRHLDAAEQRAAGDAGRRHQHPPGDPAGLISAVIVSVLAVVNQEIIMPRSPRSSRSRTTTTACARSMVPEPLRLARHHDHGSRPTGPRRTIITVQRHDPVAVFGRSARSTASRPPTSRPITPRRRSRGAG